MKKQVPTAEEKFSELMEKSLELHEKFYQIFKKTTLLHEKVEREIRGLKKESGDLLSLVAKKFKDQTETIAKCASVSETAEDTLLNVLLAIRQNEYLQAWYPAQKGFQEMNVVGSHPSTL